MKGKGDVAVARFAPTEVEGVEGGGSLSTTPEMACDWNPLS
jgi:hypothetical protein